MYKNIFQSLVKTSSTPTMYNNISVTGHNQFYSYIEQQYLPGTGHVKFYSYNKVQQYLSHGHN